MSSSIGWYDSWGVWQNPFTSAAPGPRPGTAEFAAVQLDSQLVGGLVPWNVYDAEVAQRKTMRHIDAGAGAGPGALLAMRHAPWRHPRWAFAVTAALTEPLPRVCAPPLLDPYQIATVPSPQVRSLVWLPPATVVPNFGHTPRTVVSPAALSAYLDAAHDNIVALPALARARLLRLYATPDGGWAVASNACAQEQQRHDKPGACAVAWLHRRAARGDLDRTRVYCFCAEMRRQGETVSPERDERGPVFVGSLALHTTGEGSSWEDLYAPPTDDNDGRLFDNRIGVLRPKEAGVLVRASHPPVGLADRKSGACDRRHPLRIVGRFDGVLLVNRRSGHAVRVVCPLVYALRPMLDMRPAANSVVVAFVLVALRCGHRLHGRNAEWDAHIRFVDRLLEHHLPDLRGSIAARLDAMFTDPTDGLWQRFPKFARAVGEFGPNAVLQQLSALPSIILALAAAAGGNEIDMEVAGAVTHPPLGGAHIPSTQHPQLAEPNEGAAAPV